MADSVANVYIFCPKCRKQTLITPAIGQGYNYEIKDTECACGSRVRAAAIIVAGQQVQCTADIIDITGNVVSMLSVDIPLIALADDSQEQPGTTAHFVKYNKSGKTECECGARKAHGIRDYTPGHSGYCPVRAQ